MTFNFSFVIQNLSLNFDKLGTDNIVNTQNRNMNLRTQYRIGLQSRAAHDPKR